MKTTATAAEVREHFLVRDIDKEAELVEKVLEEQLGIEASETLSLSIIATIPKEEADKLTLAEKITLVARQGFIDGFMHCLRTSAEAAEDSYKSLFGEADKGASV